MQETSAESVLLAELRELYRLPPDVPIEQLKEPVKTYVTYALGTVERGKAALERVRPYRSLEGIRYLDVGCAYGGFCAAAALAGASEVVGFDIDQRLIGIARSYLRELDVAAKIEVGDVIDEPFMAQVGAFDLITCNDVIEHVDSVPRCIANLANALAEGGVLYMAIPNRRSTLLIRSDPHFHLFGIVLLSREDAIRYHTIVTGTAHYDVGDYFGFDEYAGLLREHGLGVTVTNAPTKSAHWCIEELEPDFAKLRAENEAFNDPRLPEDLKDRARTAVSSVLDDLDGELSEYRSLLKARRSEEAAAKSLQITRDFYLATWYVIAQKPARGAGQCDG